MCFAICVLRLSFAVVFYKRVVQLCFSIVHCNCVLQRLQQQLENQRSPNRCKGPRSPDRCNAEEVLIDVKAQEVLTGEKPKKS